VDAMKQRVDPAQARGLYKDAFAAYQDGRFSIT
jgi:hypothetical protein